MNFNRHTLNFHHSKKVFVSIVGAYEALHIPFLMLESQHVLKCWSFGEQWKLALRLLYNYSVSIPPIISTALARDFFLYTELVTPRCWKYYWETSLIDVVDVLESQKKSQKQIMLRFFFFNCFLNAIQGDF